MQQYAPPAAVSCPVAAGVKSHNHLPAAPKATAYQLPGSCVADADHPAACPAVSKGNDEKESANEKYAYGFPASCMCQAAAPSIDIGM